MAYDVLYNDVRRNNVVLYHNQVVLHHQPFARTNTFLYSFVPSGAAAWNQLTEEQVTVNSLQSFKKLLH